MHTETCHDPIDVEARFGQRGMRPLWFVWQGKRRIIQEVTGAWSERDGALLHRCFAVSDGEAVYELAFDARALRWWLTKVSLDG